MAAPATGSAALDTIVERLAGTTDPKRRYEYVLWLAKKLEPLPEEFRNDAFKVKGCVSQVYVVAELRDGRLHWQGDSDAAITKGLLALLTPGSSPPPACRPASPPRGPMASSTSSG